MVITSKDNETIKHIKKLKEKKYREAYGEFMIEGAKMIEEAIQEEAPIRSIVICDDCKNQGAISHDLMYEIAKKNCIYVDEKVFSSITDVVNPQGMLAVVEKPKNEAMEIDFSQEVFLILDNVQDPGNIGTILRTADSLNMKQVLVSKGTADIYNLKVVRSTMGAIFRVKVMEMENTEKTIKELKKHKIQIYATDLQTNQSVYDVPYHKTAIVIGNEANGVSQEILNMADTKIKIPMIGKTESLNAAVATSIILYEAFRKNGSIR